MPKTKKGWIILALSLVCVVATLVGGYFWVVHILDEGDQPSTGETSTTTTTEYIVPNITLGHVDEDDMGTFSTGTTIVETRPTVTIPSGATPKPIDGNDASTSRSVQSSVK